MVDMRPRFGQSVRYESTNQANSAFHPSGVGIYMNYEGDDH